MRTALATPLGLSWDQIQQAVPVVIEPTQYPSTPKDCPKPHLGELCGADAAGAIVGIALGCAALLALIIAAVIYSYRQKSTRVVVVDDMAWQNNYTHIIPNNLYNSPYITQYAQQPAAVVVAGPQYAKYAFV